MFYPKLTPPSATRRTLSAFGGYNRNAQVPQGAFSHMQNMTSDHRPLLAPRRSRSLVKTMDCPQGIIAKQALCYVDGADFYIGGQKVEGLRLYTACDSCPIRGMCDQYVAGKSRCRKKMVSMGANVLIFPDKKWVCTQADNIQFGDMEAEFESLTAVEITLCDAAGQAYGDMPLMKPTDPDDGQYWLDGPNKKLYQWSENAAAWSEISPTYLRLSYPNIGQNFSQYDGVELRGMPGGMDGSAVLWQVGQDSLVIEGWIFSDALAAKLVIRRRIPLMDHVTVCGNRLWGCRYGNDHGGNFVNEIYCSKLGDFKNFSCFMGISTDSGVLNLGSDGPFTGAVTHLDHPLFFKENMLHKVYISDSGAHSVTDTPCQGVQAGCGESLACVSGQLYYKSRDGVCVYDGSLPQQISQDLGQVLCQRACGGGGGGKYYLCLKDDNTQLLVYDTQNGLWHREDTLNVEAFCPYQGELYAITDTALWGLFGTLGPSEGPVQWCAVTGDLGGFSPDSKYLTKLILRMAMTPDSTVAFYARYDFSEDWELLGQVTGQRLGSYRIPLRPKRCDNLRLKIQGVGDVKLHSLTKQYEKGSDMP